uniref:death-associated protein 1 homolog n=1 Tax=Myxine glutinosa TaxID=7769 RepID=UPI00358EB5E4
MASPPKEPQLKAGHPPAVKAGGKRIVQKHIPSVPPAPPTPSSDDEEYVTEVPPKFPMVVSGVVTKGDKDFTPQAAQVAHQKPLPKTEKHNITQQKMPINQPRK